MIEEREREERIVCVDWMTMEEMPNNNHISTLRVRSLALSASTKKMCIIKKKNLATELNWKDKRKRRADSSERQNARKIITN